MSGLVRRVRRVRRGRNEKCTRYDLRKEWKLNRDGLLRSVAHHPLPEIALRKLEAQVFRKKPTKRK